MKKRTAFITGATGYIGSHLCKRLIKESWDVHIIVRPNSSFINLKDFERKLTFHVYDGTFTSIDNAMKSSAPDVVFHLASLFLSEHQQEDLEPLINSNILFGIQLLEAMSKNQISYLVNTGTSWQHYENERYNPVSLYAATKQAFESLLVYYVEAKNIKSITLKLSDTYGPNDNRKKLFFLLKESSKTQEPLEMSPGEQLINLVHIEDVIEAYIQAANRLLEEGTFRVNETFFVSAESLISLKQLVALYAEIKNIDISVVWGGRPYRQREILIPWSEGEKLPSWQPKVDLINGLKTLN